MSSTAQAVLLDSNAYFRLAPSIRPLLERCFGTGPEYSLFVLAELDDEYRTNVRLQHKFAWVAELEFVRDRRAKRYQLQGQKRTEALNAFSFLDHYATAQEINLSREDLKALAAGFVMNVPVVTDDVGMQRVAEAHAIECWNTIKLLEVMVSAGRIDMDKVTEILEFLDYDHDLPMSKDALRREFKNHFGAIPCPI